MPEQLDDGDADDTLRIGVTGHRSFDRLDDATEAIDTALRQLRRDGRPIEIWSSLAEGADRLVVQRAALVGDARLVVVLPLEADEYRSDFESDSSKVEFDLLCLRASKIHLAGPDESGTRESAYERAGLAIVDAVDVLIAVWDGADARGQGGTAEIVAAARTAGDRVIVIAVTRDAVSS